jgi:hypothetical protein
MRHVSINGILSQKYNSSFEESSLRNIKIEFTWIWSMTIWLIIRGWRSLRGIINNLHIKSWILERISIFFSIRNSSAFSSLSLCKFFLNTNFNKMSNLLLCSCRRNGIIDFCNFLQQWSFIFKDFSIQKSISLRNRNSWAF